jgi:hypothetical protein
MGRVARWTALAAWRAVPLREGACPQVEGDLAPLL